MGRITETFKHGKAFIPFITAGDPSLDVTEELIIQMSKAGADLIEIGIPFSDPVAEGIVIQRASARALAAGTTTNHIFQMVERVRKRTEVPLVFMTYINLIYTYGKDKFLHHCKQYGIDGVIVPDLPFEEKSELQPYCDKYGVDLISLVAPTSEERIKMIVKEAQGFIYCVSSLGVTGVREKIDTDIHQMIQAIKETKEIPCAVGFGISTPEQAREIAQYSDGIIVGSHIVKMVETYKNECIQPVCEYVRMMKEAINEV